MTAATNFDPAAYSVLNEPSLLDDSIAQDVHGGHFIPGGEPLMQSAVPMHSVMNGPIANSYDPGSPVPDQAGSFFDTGAAGSPCVFGPGCDVSYYVNYEALWLRREGDDRFSLTQFARMPKFDYELGRIGGRITAGRLFDCHNGVEAVYTGPYEWQRGVRRTGSNVDSNFFPTGGYVAADISSFNDGVEHIQTWEAKLNSYEVNRTWWTWDVLQTLIGLRYIDYSEDYALSTARVAIPAGNGLLRETIKNRAVGLQIGGQFIKPASLRLNYGLKGKAAVLGNFMSSSTFMSNAGNLLLDNGDDRTKISGAVELGAFMNYQIVPSVRLTAGYEFWYLPRFATVPGQGLTSITPSTGSSVDYHNDLFIHGGSVGVQVLY
jgi:hypothetical protein